MKNDLKIVGKFYMKSGVVIEEEVVFDKDNDEESIEKFIADIKYRIKEGFREDYNFQLTYGNTMFRGKDVSAVAFIPIKAEEASNAQSM